MVEDWYERLLADGLLDVLAPYTPVVVGSYPLAVARDGDELEIACRAADLGAFARLMERQYGEREGFGVFGGSLDGEDAVFAEFELDGLPVQVAAQREHVHRRLGAATLGVARVLDERGPGSRARLAAAVAAGDDWLEAAMTQLVLSRTALESLAGARPAIVRRVSGAPGTGPGVGDYAVALLVGFVAETLIALVAAARGSTELAGLMFVLEAAVLGAVFGARLGLIASLLPLGLFALVAGAGELVGGSGTTHLGDEAAGYTFLVVLVASAAGIAGAVRDRYFPRA